MTVNWSLGKEHDFYLHLCWVYCLKVLKIRVSNKIEKMLRPALLFCDEELPSWFQTVECFCYPFETFWGDIFLVGSNIIWSIYRTLFVYSWFKYTVCFTQVSLCIARSILSTHITWSLSEGVNSLNYCLFSGCFYTSNAVNYVIWFTCFHCPIHIIAVMRSKEVLERFLFMYHLFEIFRSALERVLKI